MSLHWYRNGLAYLAALGVYYGVVIFIVVTVEVWPFAAVYLGQCSVYLEILAGGLVVAVVGVTLVKYCCLRRRQAGGLEAVHDAFRSTVCVRRKGYAGRHACAQLHIIVLELSCVRRKGYAGRHAVVLSGVFLAVDALIETFFNDNDAVKLVYTIVFFTQFFTLEVIVDGPFPVHLPPVWFLAYGLLFVYTLPASWLQAVVLHRVFWRVRGWTTRRRTAAGQPSGPDAGAQHPG